MRISDWSSDVCSSDLEVLLDIAARQIGIDAGELRRRNLLRLDERPYPNANGMPYDHISPLETFDEAMRILDLDDFRRQQSEARAAGRYLGLGTSSYVEPTATAMGYYGTEGATSRIEPSGADRKSKSLNSHHK